VQRISPELSSTPLILLSAALLTLGYNTAFFANTLRSYPLGDGNVGFLLSLVLLLFCLTVLLLALVGNRFTLKPVLMVIFPGAALGGPAHPNAGVAAGPGGQAQAAAVAGGRRRLPAGDAAICQPLL
jgi:hypothetical protein